MARYQPIVIEKTTEILCILEESNFFKDYEIENFDFAIKYLNDKLTEKFILGELDEDSDNLFEEEEFNVILREIIAGTILTELKQKGLVNSYEDDNTEELFFLTQKGKKMLKNDGDFNIR
jgi:DNA-binding MarR family transcriptional regulator